MKTLSTQAGGRSLDHVTHLRAPIRNPQRMLPELMGAAISAGMALASAAAVLRLWRAHLNVPLWPTGDTLPTLMIVKNMQTTGWFQGTPELGAPFGQDLTAFPSSVGDTWHMVILKVLSTFLSPAATVNVFFIVGFPVVAAVAYWCLRLLRVSRPFACVLGVAYSLLPYHFMRGEGHLLLGSYFALPIACVVAVSLYSGRLALWANPRRMPRAAWAALAAAVLLAGTGSYYAGFTIVLFAAAGGLASIATRTWRPLFSGAALVTVIGAGLALAALPNLLHTAPPGSQIAFEGRSYADTEFYGLKITNLLLPIANHRIAALAHLRAITADSPIPGEGMETLGIVGVIGLVAVMLAVLIPALHRQSELVHCLRPLGALAIVAVLTGTVAGLNSVLAVLGFGDLRAWNRISVLIGFLALAGFGHLCDAGRSRWSGGTLFVRRFIVSGAAGLILLFSIYDQTSPGMIPDYASTTASWDSDEAYFAQVENELGKSASVFALPYAPFPEYPPIVKMTDYSHLRGYLHSDLRWNYGGVKKEESEWQPAALQNGIAAALPKLVVAGFDAIYINRLGYADAGAELESEISAAIGRQSPLVNADGTLAMYDLRSYAKNLNISGGRLPSREWVLHPISISYGIGFYPEESTGTTRWRWAQGSADMTLVNPSPKPTEVVLRGSVHVGNATAMIRVRIGEKETRLRAMNGLAVLAIPTTLKPGINPVEISTDSSATQSAGDVRDLRQQLIDFDIVHR